ncbi:hypothetical protein GCM10010302_54360 [Streptomyces polychromogenes]|uniref:Lipoprotein n=1 Tax=Streptomyces polychromogenes TaxID=67342 RepID=A0ABN0VKN1_9ACTN
MRAMRAAGAAAAVLLAAVSLAGCGDDGSPGGPAPAGATAPATATPPEAHPTAPPTAPPTATPAPPGTTPAAPPTTAPAPSAPSTERLLRVTRSGGFAGRTRTLLVNGDGSWTLLGERDKEVRKGRLAPSGLEDLRTALRAADFAHLPRRTTADPPVYDGFTYSFAYGGFEVAADQTALPPALSRVLEALPGFDSA